MIDIEKVIENISLIIPDAHGADNSKLRELITQALQEKAGRDKGCEYCKGMPHRYKGFAFAEYYEQIDVDFVNEESIKVIYCPNCGRKLEVRNEND